MKRSIILAAVWVCFVIMTGPACMAADFPTKPVTLIVPTPAGGGRDVQARSFAPLAQKLLGQPVVVSNKPGANGLVGLLSLNQSAPDGHTLGVSSPTDIEAILWETENGRKPAVNHDDFVYIGIITTSPHLLAVPYNSPWKTLADLIRDAKAKPGFYSFASSGVNAGTHLSAEFFMEATGLKFRHVPFEGGGKAVTAIVGGHVDFGLVVPSSAMQLVRGNKLRILSVQTAKRYPFLPDVPTLGEQGVKGGEAYGFVGLIAPKKTPEPVLAKLREVTKKVTEDKEFIGVIEKLGDDVNFITGDEVNRMVVYETEKRSKLYQRLVKEQAAK
jgi:tripartite-type tricarboxylate transporter receptor subunit TctC